MAYTPGMVPSQTDRVLAEYIARELRRIGVELTGLSVTIDGIDTSFSGSFTLALGNTFITVTDETATLANSRRLVAGSNVVLSYSTSHQVIVSATYPAPPADISGLSYVTVDDETGDAPNSMQLTAGDNVELSITGNAIVIHSTGGGGSGVTLDEVREALNADEEFRDEVVVNYWPGIVTNAQSLSHTVSAAVRVANGLAFQECIDYCVGRQKTLIFNPDSIDIDLPGGLEIRAVGIDNTTGDIVPVGTADSTTRNATGFTWRANSVLPTITQYATDTPILTIAPTSGGAQFGIDFFGCTLHYGQNEGSNTNSNALVLGPLWLCRIGGIRIGSSITANQSYRGIYNPQTEFFFSNHLYDIKVFRSTQNLLRISSTGTGNLFNNIYLSGVLNTGTAAGNVALPFVYSHPTSGQVHGNIFNQFNIEWCISNKLMEVQNARGMVFNGSHIEQNRFSGSNGCFLHAIISDVQFNGLMLLDNRFQTGTVSGTAPSIFNVFNDSGITVKNMGIRLSSESSYVNTNFFLFHQNTGITNTPAQLHIDNLRLQDAGGSLRRHLKIDSADINATYGELALLAAGDVRVGEPMGQIDRGDYTLAATTAFYGTTVKNAFIRAPASLSSTLVVQLSRFMGPTGSRGDLVPIERGMMATVRRSAGTAINPMIIDNLEEGSRIVASITGGTSLRLVFDGARWGTQVNGSRGETLRYGAGVVSYDDNVMANAGSGERHISLPALATCLGRRLTFKKVDDSTNVVVIDGNAAETIDGLTARTLSAQYQFLTIIAGALDWHIIGR